MRFTVDTTSYTVTLDPRQIQPAALARVNPIARDLGTLAVAARQASAIELRIPLSFLDRADRLTLDRVRWIDSNGVEITSDTLGVEIPKQDEVDGVFRPTSIVGQTGSPFTIAGTLGSALWTAHGRVDTVALSPGASWHVEMEVDYGATDVPNDARMIGTLALLPIARSVDGMMRVVGGVNSNNGWSGVLTPGGLPIDNLPSRVTLGEAVAQPYQIIRGKQALDFPLDFTLRLPLDLPPGLYIPVFTGYTQTADGVRTAWDQGGTTLARLPLVVNVGGVQDVRLLWTLFADSPSDGSRGILPTEDQSYAALSNRVRFNSPTYILPPFQTGTRDPIDYPLEPYLLDELPNRYKTSTAPLIPFRFPGGQIEAQVTRPDGTVDDLGSADIVQNQLSTDAVDERTLFGEESPVDEYRLTTLDPKFSAYQFTQYGEYQITLKGDLQDIYGNHYEGGGSYTVLAAEQLDLTPGVLPGTPFEVGNALNFGLHVSPGVPADVTVTVRVYPLDGGAMVERSVTGKAGANGYFQPNNVPFAFSTPGEYVIDYEARYDAPDQRLWAASLRSAGVIAGLNPTLVAHGERGVPGVSSDVRPAWFNTQEYAQVVGSSANMAQLFFPYHSGDVAWIDDGRDSGIVPEIRVQDLHSENGDGAYAQQVIASLPDYTSGSGLSIRQLAAEDELPVYNNTSALMDQVGSYTYVSAVRPNVTVRQYVSGGDDGGLPLYWDDDDPLNRQIGAGIGGNRPGDFIFLFGGAVIRAGDVRDTAIYGALAVVTANDTPRVYPPDRGSAGGADGGALLTVNDQPVDMFVDLTGVQPGEVLTVGDTLAVVGQVAPPLAARVTTTFTTPSGRVLNFTGKANSVGYYYNPANRLMVDEPGVWTVSVHVQEEGATSAGQVEPPLPQGSVLGAHDEQFQIYVLPQDAEPLPWNRLLTDTIIPIVSPYNFSFILPEDWTDIQAYYTLTTPGYIIEEAPLRVSGRNFSYQYTAPLQSRAFPNLENDGRSGSYVADVRTLTFVATGVDGSGAPQIRSRTFTLMHDRLITGG